MAIAYDSSAQANNGATTTLVVPITCTGSNRGLVFFPYWGNSRTIISCDYAGVPMNQTLFPLDTTGGERHGMFDLPNPASGTNNLTFVLSGSTGIVGIAASYTGVNQTAMIGAIYTEIGLETGTTMAESLTTLTDNSWVAWSTRDYAGRTITAGANTALRQRENSVYGMIMADSNAAVSPAGARTLNLNANLSANWYSDILAEIKPATGGGGGTPTPQLMMMGVGL